MEAKDTVMTEKELEEYWRNPDECDDMGIAEDQAEISFKAGMREVVEWVERNKKIKIPKYQLKEWGID